MDADYTIKPDELVLLNDSAREFFRGKTMIVEVVRGWGVIGLVGGIYPYRAPWEQIEGRAP